MLIHRYVNSNILEILLQNLKHFFKAQIVMKLFQAIFTNDVEENFILLFSAHQFCPPFSEKVETLGRF